MVPPHQNCASLPFSLHLQLGKEFDPRLSRTPADAEITVLKYRLVRSEAARWDASQQFAVESHGIAVQMQVCTYVCVCVCVCV